MSDAGENPHSLQRAMEQEAKISALKQQVATQAARMAKETRNPEEFIMTLTAPFLQGLEDAEDLDPAMQILLEASAELAEDVEQIALSQL